jgi:hypothetical protein
MFWMRKIGTKNWFKISGEDFLAYDIGYKEIPEGFEVARFD